MVQSSISFRETVEKKKEIKTLQQKMNKIQQAIQKLESEKEQNRSKQLKQVIRINREIKRKQSRSNELQQQIDLIEKDLEERREVGFDDELFDNMKTTGILMTDNTYTPPSNIPDNNNYRRDVLQHMVNLKYDPSKEREKYNYDKIMAVRNKEV